MSLSRVFLELYWTFFFTETFSKVVMAKVPFFFFCRKSLIFANFWNHRMIELNLLSFLFRGCFFFPLKMSEWVMVIFLLGKKSHTIFAGKKQCKTEDRKKVAFLTFFDIWNFLFKPEWVACILFLAKKKCFFSRNLGKNIASYQVCEWLANFSGKKKKTITMVMDSLKNTLT